MADAAAIALHVERARDLLSPAFAREAVRDQPELAENVRATLRSLLPAVAEALTPPDRDGTDWEALGASADEIRDFAVSGLARRLKIVGVPLDSVLSPPA